LPAGDYTVTQMSFAGNATHAPTSVALTQRFGVPKTAQSISFAPLPGKTEGDPDFGVFANASSGLATAYAASGNCTISANLVHLTAAGSCTITASQPGDANYEAAAPVAQSFAIATNGKADQVITFGPAPSNVHAGDSPLTISATSTSPTAPPSGIPIVFSSLTTSICTTGGTNGETLTPLAQGTCTIAANQAGDANYNPAPQVLLSFSVAAAGPSAQFASTADMLAARSDHTATLLEDGRVLIAGGFGAGGTVLGTAELYCSDNGTSPPDFTVCPSAQRGKFFATNPLAVPAAGQTATRLHDGTVLLIGGANATLQWFTPATQTWSSSGPLALADRSFHTATLLANGKVFVAGGLDSTGTTLATTFLVDASTTPWTITAGPNLNLARESHTATLLPDGTVLIAGGRRKQSVDFAIVAGYELYDPSVAGPLGNGAITDEGAMSRGRFWHAAEIAGLRVLVTGGSCDPATAVSNALTSTEFFSFSTGPEPAVACNAPAGPSDLVQARRAFTLTSLPDSALVAIGGADGSGVSRSTSEIFGASAATFALGPSLTVARAEHQATLLLDGRVLVTGGVATGGAPLASAELFTGASGASAANQRPIANAGTNQNVMVGATVQLSSAGSTDPEGRPLAYYWTITSTPAGSTALLSNANAANPTFVVDRAGAYGVQLIVNDGGTPPLDSVPATVQITAGSANQAPVAENDAYATAQDTTLTVNAASGVLVNDTDADGNPLTAVLDTTATHGTLTLNADGSFTYVPAAGYSGSDAFTYHANDGTANSNSANVAITVNPSVPTNHPPVANAGSDQSVTIGQLAQLNGTCTDADNDPTTPTWSITGKPEASTATLSSTSILNPTITPDVAGSYALQLVCNDGKVDSAPSTVTITATSGGTLGVALANTSVVGVGRSANVTVTLSVAAPSGGLNVALASDNASILGVATPTVTIAAGQTQTTGSVVGIAAGTTTLRVSASGYVQGTLSVDVSVNLISAGGSLSVPLNGSATLPITITPAAPAGGLVVSLTSSDTTIASLASPTVSIPGGQTSASATVNGIATGATTVLAHAKGYPSDVATVTVGIPATVTVTNLNDSGAGSLRDAIAQANASSDANTIVFAAGVTGTITLTSGQIRISGPVTIVGPGAANLTFDGTANARIFVNT
jgi:VCBS repeat-containing protein